MKSYETGYPNNWGMGVGAHETEIFATFSTMRHFSKKKNSKNRDFEGSVDKCRGVRGQKFDFRWIVLS